MSLWARMIKNTDWSTGPLARLFARTTHSLICSLRTARCAYALRCAHLFTCSLSGSLPSSWESGLSVHDRNASISHNIHPFCQAQPLLPRACNYYNMDWIRLNSQYVSEKGYWRVPAVRYQETKLPDIGTPNNTAAGG